MRDEITPELRPLACSAPGTLWWRFDSLGVTREEIELLVTHQLPEKRASELRALVDEATKALAEILPFGIQDWMSRKRAMN